MAIVPRRFLRIQGTFDVNSGEPKATGAAVSSSAIVIPPHEQKKADLLHFVESTFARLASRMALYGVEGGLHAQYMRRPSRPELIRIASLAIPTTVESNCTKKNMQTTEQHSATSDEVVEVEHRVSFTLALDSAVYSIGQGGSPPPEMTAHIRFCSTVSPPVVLHFFSLQRFDLDIINDAGAEVYKWSAGRVFPMLAQNISVTGEVHWKVAVPLADAQGTPLPAGQYIAQAYLTLHTDPSTRNKPAFARKYAGSVLFSIQS
jgi:hypothetical protein